MSAVGESRITQTRRRTTIEGMEPIRYHHTKARVIRHALGTSAAWAVVIVCSPLILLFGKTPIRMRDRRMLTAREYGRRGRPVPARRRPRFGPMPFGLRLVTNPLFIALTAPRRWVRSTLLPGLGIGRRWRRLPGGDEGLWPDAPPFFGGVREPRRPKPAPSAAGVALREPRIDLDRLRQELMGEAAQDIADHAQRPRRTDTPANQDLSGGGLAASA